VDNRFEVQRPHAPAELLQRQGSFRGFSRLAETSSPFKRQMSLRLDELSVNSDRMVEYTQEGGLQEMLSDRGGGSTVNSHHELRSSLNTQTISKMRYQTIS